MKKLLLLSAILLASTNSFADCTVDAVADTGRVPFGEFTFNGIFKVNLANRTNETQTYSICYEVHSQYWDNSHHYQIQRCDTHTLAPYEAFNADNIKVPLTTKYQYHQGVPNGVHLDAIVHIRGESSCYKDAHRIATLGGPRG